MSGCPSSDDEQQQKDFRWGRGEFGKDEDSEGCPWRLEKCSAKLAQDSGDYYGSITGITVAAPPSLMYAAGQPFPGSGWFLYRLNLNDNTSVAYIEEMIPLRCALLPDTSNRPESVAPNPRY